MISQTVDLLVSFAYVNIMFMAIFAGSSYLLWDKNHSMQERVRKLETSAEIARDRVTYLYDQLSRVETKADVQATLEDLQETVDAFIQADKEN